MIAYNLHTSKSLFYSKTNVIPNSISGKPSKTITIIVDINIIPLAIRLFLIKKNAKFEVFWP